MPEPLDSLIAAEERRVAERWGLTQLLIAEEWTPRRLAEAIAEGNQELYISSLAALPLAVREARLEGIQRAGTLEGQTIAEATQSAFVFNFLDSSAVQDVRDLASFSDQTFLQNQREAVNWMIAAGWSAQEIIDSMGLTLSQVQAIGNYGDLLSLGSQDALDRALANPGITQDILSAEVVTGGMIGAAMAGYRRNYQDRRRTTIAESTALGAVNAGAYSAQEQAQDRVERVWRTRGDAKVRDSHRGLSGQVRGLNETWQGAAGELRFPGDPRAPTSEIINCRCWLEVRIK